MTQDIDIDGSDGEDDAPSALFLCTSCDAVFVVTFEEGYDGCPECGSV